MKSVWDFSFEFTNQAKLIHGYDICVENILSREIVDILEMHGLGMRNSAFFWDFIESCIVNYNKIRKFNSIISDRTVHTNGTFWSKMESVTNYIL